MALVSIVSPYFIFSLKGWKYFVKRAGYSSIDNTWEPEGHLSPALLRYAFIKNIETCNEIRYLF
jgi:hypothetical protein